MLDLFSDIGWSVISNIIQMAAGSLLAVIVYRLFCKDCYTTKLNTRYSFLIIIMCSIIGLLLPTGTYGVIPLALMLLAVGVKYEYVLPVVISNAMFNTLSAYADQSFSWKTGLGRIALAFTAGLVFALIFKLHNNRDIVNLKTNCFSKKSSNIFLHFISYLSENINSLGLYLIAGAVLNALFHKYFYVGLVDTIFLNPNLSKTVTYFLRFDIANPYIQYTFNLFSNLTCLAALISFLKPKGLFALIITYSVLTLLFSIVAFI